MRERRTERKSRKRRFGARLMAVILAAGIAAAAAAGCGVKQEEPDDGRLKIVTTIFPQYDFVRAIAGDTGAVSVRMLLSPGEEVHSYEPTPLDIKEIQSCDLFIYVGAENDVWVDRILENMGDKRPQTLRLVDLTETVEEESVEGMMEEKGRAMLTKKAMIMKTPMKRRQNMITKTAKSTFTAAIPPMRSTKRRMSMCGRLL